MRFWLGVLAAATALGLGHAALSADYKTLRNLNAPPPSATQRLPEGAKARPVQFSKIVIHPKDGEAWAIAYTSVIIRAEGDKTPVYEFLTWRDGRVEAETASFSRAFDDELGKAGFKGDSGQSLFDDNSGSADLKVGVLVDDIKGRFCVDCPNLFNRNGVPASVIMTAHWEVYSSLDRKVVAKISTSGGADYMTKLQGSVTPAVLEAFRENVRQLIASEDFRRVVTAPPGSTAPAAEAPAIQTPISLRARAVADSVALAPKSVAIVYAADGQGSGFLVSNDGYVLTNQHVVGGSKYVKLKWANGAESLGEVVRSDRRRDVALIKVDAQGRSPLALRTGPVQQGEAVFAIGTPLDDKMQNTMTKGIVSAERTDRGLRFIQSDAAVTHGNSGGPLLDEKGRVVAMTVSGFEPDGVSHSLNLFIPIDEALNALALTQTAAVEPSAAPKAAHKAH
jgi:S1-C subfamily serine protease